MFETPPHLPSDNNSASESDIQYIARAILNEINTQKQERTKAQNEEEKVVTKRLEFKDANDYVEKMIAYARRIWIKGSEKDLRDKYMSKFLSRNIEWDFARHLPWLKRVSLKQLEWALTDEIVAEIAEMLSLVSTTFWIDFNKVIMDKDLSMNIAQNIWTYVWDIATVWLMSPRHSVERLKEFLQRVWKRWDVYDLWEEIATAWVSVSLKDWPERAGSIMAHELWHLIDFALSTEEWLPLLLKKPQILFRLQGII